MRSSSFVAPIRASVATAGLFAVASFGQGGDALDDALDAATKFETRQDIAAFIERAGAQLNVTARAGDEDGQIVTGDVRNRDGEIVEPGFQHDNVMRLALDGGNVFIKSMTSPVLTIEEGKTAGFDWSDLYRKALASGAARPVDLTVTHDGLPLVRWLRNAGYLAGEAPPAARRVDPVPPSAQGRGAKRAPAAGGAAVRSPANDNQQIDPRQVFHPKVLSPKELDEFRNAYVAALPTHPNLPRDVSSIVTRLRLNRIVFRGDWVHRLSAMRATFGDEYATLRALLLSKSESVLAVVSSDNAKQGVRLTPNDVLCLWSSLLVDLDFLRPAALLAHFHTSPVQPVDASARSKQYSLRPDVVRAGAIAVGGVGPFTRAIFVDTTRGKGPFTPHPVALSVGGATLMYDDDDREIEVRDGDVLVPFQRGDHSGLAVAVLTEAAGARRLVGFVRLSNLPDKVASAIGFEALDRTTAFKAYVSQVAAEDSVVSRQWRDKPAKP